jgi:hypothetical protein
VGHASVNVCQQCNCQITLLSTKYAVQVRPLTTSTKPPPLLLLLLQAVQLAAAVQHLAEQQDAARP